MLLALLALAPALGGCGASTLRLSVASTLDTVGRPGVEAVVSLGIGSPIDFRGRSRHYIQNLVSLGGGLDAATRSGEFLTRADASYIYWGGPHLDVRFGGGFAWRQATYERSSIGTWSLGAHGAVVPIVWEDAGGWLVSQIGLGLELRAEGLAGDRPLGGRGLFSAAFIAEANFLAAGD